MTPQVLELAADLARRREPFVLATVVWARRPSSGRQGSAAVVLPDGTLRGWLGGACAEPTVVRESLLALEDGRPRLLVMGPTDERALPEGARSIPMACASEGALQVYLDPLLPPPHVVVIGRSPAVDTLAALAQALGWMATIVDDGGTGEPLDMASLGVDAGTCVIVATQGHYDEDALQAALETDAGYVGLVASAPRAKEVLRVLGDRGVPQVALDRVRAPAGLDLGRIDHQEIAVAILAELVARRAAGELRGRGGAAAGMASTAVDPVCHMTVDAGSTHHRAEHQGTTYFFCAAACQREFEADPARYARDVRSPSRPF
jgi:xanthine dehydrogenase accessory factor